MRQQSGRSRIDSDRDRNDVASTCRFDQRDCSYREVIDEDGDGNKGFIQEVADETPVDRSTGSAG